MWLWIFLGVIGLSILMIGVQKAFQKKNLEFSMKQVSSQKTGYQTAMEILQANGINNVSIVSGKEGQDHFNPKTMTISLSPSLYGSASLSAVTIAAHEACHAIQWHKGEVKIKIRDGLVEPVQAIAKVGNAVLMVGFFSMFIFSFAAASSWIIIAGLSIYGATGLFTFATLPVEFDASRKAIKQLEGLHIVDPSEIDDSKKLLRSAAMTYVMAFLVSAVMFTFYLLMLLGGRNRN